MSKNLLIDLGNTACKVAFAKEREIVETIRGENGAEPMPFLQNLLGNNVFEIIVFSSVQRRDPNLMALLQSRCNKLIVVDGDTQTALKIEYQTSDRLGADILAYSLGAVVRFPGEDVMVICFGTAITVSSIDKNGLLTGVNISPGLMIRLQALHQYTDGLPLIFLEEEEEIPGMGIDTRGAITAGVVKGIVHEIEGYIAKNQDKKIIFTGGDALFFAKQLKTPIFVDCNLIFIGLAEIAQSYAE
ncbi:MAG: type III pantothenate kinase [Bacteroidales bacterium]|nr:type III pantothenate kinase [Bacteroidales bacterium]